MAGLASGLMNIGRGGYSPSTFKAPAGPKPPRSIIAQALAGHPNWSGQPQSGVSSAGTALLGAQQLTKPQAAGAPANPPPSVTAPSASGGSPLDSTYYQNVAQNQFAVNNHINALNLQQSQDQTALQSALAALAYQQPRDQLALEQRANAGGGLYSSVEDMNQANLMHGYATRQATDQSNYGNAAGRIAAQIAALQQGIPIYNAGQAEAAGQRAAQAALNNPGLAAPPAAPAAPAGAAPAVSGRPGKPSVGRAGSALLGALGALSKPAGAGGAGGALSNRQKLANQLSKKGKR